MRKFSLVLIAVGAFLIVLGPMIRWYAYPRLAVAPVNQISDTGLVGEDATIFDISTLKEIQTTLTTTVHTVGDASTPDKHDGAVTYVNSTSTRSADGVMRSRDVERMTFDARTGEAIGDCCGDFISDTEGVETEVVHQGLVAKFPFDTQKKTYDFWDGTVKAAAPIKFAGTGEIEGLTVYEFKQTVEPTETGTMEVPLSLLGLDGDETVKAQQMYSVDRDLFVEPNTGVIIKRTESVNTTLDYQGEPRITLTKAVVGYDADTIRKNVDEYGSQGSMLKMVRSTVPQLSFVIGLIAVIGGVLMSRRRQSAPGNRVKELHETHA